MTLSKVAQVKNASDTISLIDEAKQKEIVMGIKPEAMKFILDRLTYLYPNPILSLIREVISNGIDATMMLPEEQRKAVEVSTPSFIVPKFIVKDYGIGMSLEDVNENYTQYGGTTKRNDFNQLGAYGLGAKSPLAYCAEFYVRTTKNGITTEFIISKEPTQNMTTILSSEYTGEESGTTVTIPVKIPDISKFSESITKYQEFTPDVPLLIDDVSYNNSDDFILIGEQNLDEETNLKGRVWIKKSGIIDYFGSHVDSNWIDNRIKFILSGWPYERHGLNGNKYRYYQTGVFYVELKPGVVDFSSSRDEITQNERLEYLVSNISKNFAEGTQEAKQKMFESVMSSVSEKDYFSIMRKFMSQDKFTLSDDKQRILIKSTPHYMNSSSKDKALDATDVVSAEGKNFFTLMNANKNINNFMLISISSNTSIGFSYHDEDNFTTLGYSKTTNNPTNFTGCLNQLVINYENKSKFRTDSFVRHTLVDTAQLVIVNNFDKDLMKTLRRGRKSMLTLFGSTVLSANFLFVDNEIPQETIDFLELCGKSVQQFHQKDFIKMVEDKRIELNNEKPKKPKETSLIQTVHYKTPIDVMSIHEEASNKSFLSFKTIDEIINGEYLVVFSSDSMKRVIIGLNNSGVDVSEKEILTIKKLNLSQLVKLEKRGNFYVDSTVNHRSKYAVKLSKKIGVAPAAKFSINTDNIDISDLISIACSFPNPNATNQFSVLRFSYFVSYVEKIDKYITNPEIKKVTDKVLSANVSSRYAEYNFDEQEVKDKIGHEVYDILKFLSSNYSDINNASKYYCDKYTIYNAVFCSGRIEDKTLSDIIRQHYVKRLESEFENLNNSVENNKN